MEAVKVQLELGMQKRGSSNKIEVYVDHEIFLNYLNEYILKFAQNKDYYRFGKMSGKVIFEGRTYGNVSKFAKSLETSQSLEDNIFLINKDIAKLYENELSFHSWISLDNFIFDHFEELIIQEIFKVNNKKYPPIKIPLQTKTYNYGNKEVVFFSFYQACYDDSDLYAVPVEIATELCLEDFDGKEMSRWDNIWSILEEYKVREELIINCQCIEAYNHD